VGDVAVKNTRAAAGAKCELWTAILPVVTDERVVAVVYADEGTRTGESAPSFDRQVGLDLAERLIGHAGRRVAALHETAGVELGSTPDTPPPSEARDASLDKASRQEEPSSDRAREYARLLVSEITRYPQADPATPLEPRLSERLAEDVEQLTASAASDRPANLSRLLSVRR
jgi:hypothetical protein